MENACKADISSEVRIVDVGAKYRKVYTLLSKRYTPSFDDVFPYHKVREDQKDHYERARRAAFAAFNERCALYDPSAANAALVLTVTLGTQVQGRTF